MAIGTRFQSWTLAILTSLLPAAVSARANIIVAVQLVTANPGTTGNPLEITLQNTGAPVTIAGFDFRITTTDTDITFTGTNENTPNPYIFTGDSFDITNSFSENLLGPGQTMDGNDVSQSGAGTLVGTGATFGLGRVLFNVSPTALTGPFAITLITDVADTSLSGVDGVPVPINTFANGQITIQNIPEPATALLAAMGLAGVVWLKRRRVSG